MPLSPRPARQLPAAVRGRAIAGALGVALAATLVGCTTSGSEEPTSTTLTLGYIDAAGAAMNFNPLIPPVSGPGDPLIHTVYEHLMEYDDSSGEIQYVPGLATDWAFNEDFTELSLTLREGVVFSDGEPFDAEALATILDYRLSQEGFLREFAHGYTITGEHSITLEIEAPRGPDGYLKDQWEQLPIVSPAALDDLESLETMPVGSGPYVLDASRTEPGVEYVLVRSETYRDPERYAFDTVIVKSFSDQVAAANALKSGQIDLAPANPSTAADLEASGFQIHTAAGLWAGLFIPDLAGKIQPALADLRVRQAMSMAFDRAAIIEAVDRGYGLPVIQPFGPGQPQYLPDRQDDFPYDPERARELLAEAGYPDGFDISINDYGIYPYAPSIVQYLGDIGIRVTMEPVPVADSLKTYQSARFPVLFLSGSYTNVVPFWVAPDALGSGSYDIDHDPQLVADLRASEVGATEEIRREAAQRVGEYVHENVWFLILSHPSIIYASSDEIDVQINELNGWYPFVHNIKPAE